VVRTIVSTTGKRQTETPSDCASPPLPPILPAGARSIAQIEEFYQKLFGLYQILECRFVTLDEIDCIWVILTMSLQSQSAIYIGCLTIPFADFTFEFTIATGDDSAMRPEALSRLRHEYECIRLSLRLDSRVKDQKRSELPTKTT
jgi:hypothetical protein